MVNIMSTYHLTLEQTVDVDHRRPTTPTSSNKQNMMGSDDSEQVHDGRSNGHARAAQHHATDSNSNDPDDDGVWIPSGTSDDAPTKKRTARKGEVSTPSSSSSPAVPGKRRVRKSKKSLDAEGSSAEETKRAIVIKYAALLLLVAQMVGLVLLMRYSRTVPRGPNEPLYLASTAVFIMEIMKLVLCLGVVAYDCGGLAVFLQELHLHTIGSPFEILKLCVPSLLYTVQNNLLYLALTNLDAATYQVCYQLKILTTAVFSAVLLQRKFSPQKWAALILLTVGVAIVQISGSSDQHSAGTTHGDSHESELHAQQAADEAATASRNRWIGLVAVVCAAGTSGFSGVYFEKILKGSRTSLWIRNIQMGLPSVMIAYITVYVKDAAAVRRQGFLGGYSSIVWTVVTVQAVGGLIVATVVKYADNVLKVFATSFSIVISCIISAFLFDFHPTMSFLVGASLVVTATVMYSSPEKKPRRKTILPLTTRK